MESNEPNFMEMSRGQLWDWLRSVNKEDWVEGRASHKELVVKCREFWAELKDNVS